MRLTTKLTFTNI